MERTLNGTIPTVAIRWYAKPICLARLCERFVQIWEWESRTWPTNWVKTLCLSWGMSMAFGFEEFAQLVRGLMAYFGMSDYYCPIPELDEWLHGRISTCYWKNEAVCTPKSVTFWSWDRANGRQS
jgi:hypothetical protein